MTTDSDHASYTAFSGYRRIASGPLQGVAAAAKKDMESGAGHSVLIFDDSSGRVIDMDPRRSAAAAVIEPRARGRPKLGVVAREVTLLPRHWDWLATQPGGASVALRKLVEEARRTHAEKDRRRQAQERAYYFMSEIAGDMPGFEEAARALFANDQDRLRAQIAAWPDDVRDHAIALAFAD
jgi:uncharacterized protein